MSFLNPIWLWGLSALAIPVGIHLLSRKEGKTIRIGSIRFLTETSTSKFSSIRLNEVVLLALRSLLVILIVLFLSSLIVEVPNSKTSRKWALVEQGLENKTHIRTLLDSLQKNEFEIRRLAEDFPVMDSDTAQTNSDYYKLAEALSKENDLQSIVFATNSLSGFKGKRNSLPENITWLSYPLSTKENTYTHDRTFKSDTLRITLAYDKEFEDDKKIIQAALNVIQDAAPKKIVVTETDTQNLQSYPNSDWLIWLSIDEPVNNGKMLYFRENMFDDLIENETQNKWVLTKHVTEANAVDQHLPVKVMTMLFQKEIKSEIIRQDQRTASNALVWSNAVEVQSSSAAASSQPVDKILFVCISLLFIAERILAFYRKQ